MGKAMRHTELGRLSSRPWGAFCWTVSGTLESPTAWEVPWPRSFCMVGDGLVGDGLVTDEIVGVDRLELVDGEMILKRRLHRVLYCSKAKPHRCCVTVAWMLHVKSGARCGCSESPTQL